MPIGDVVGEVAAQLAMEAGGNAIHRRFGWKVCVAAVLIVVAAIAALIWLVS